MENVIAVYTDGGVIGANPSHKGGMWAWCGVDENNNVVIEKSGILLPDSRYPEMVKISNNHTELYAVCKALASLPDGWCGTLYSDSHVTLCRLKSAPNKETMPNVPGIWLLSLQNHLRRLGRFHTVLLDGHPTEAQLTIGKGKRGNPCSRFNVWCDEECNRVRKEWERTCGE